MKDWLKREIEEKENLLSSFAYTYGSKTNSPIMSFGGGFGEPKYGLNANYIDSKQIGLLKGYSTKSRFNIENIKTRFYKDNSSQLNITQNISNNVNYEKTLKVHKSDQTNNNVRIENPFEIPAAILSDPYYFNSYKHSFKNEMYAEIEVVGNESDTTSNKVNRYKVKVAPSLFSPLNMVQNIGISSNVPLTANTRRLKKGAQNASKNSYYENISDCSIKELVELSRQKNSILGNARYTYADFMYCKDLGKVSNNHLLTLRRFPYPIGDNIFESSITYNSVRTPGDIGRLITWFDTEENKLDSILHYSYKATWKPLNAKIDEIESKENEEARGPLGKLINTLSIGYNKTMANGENSGEHSFWGYLGLKGDTSQLDRMRNYDNNKVYTPKNTIQDTHTYEGKLEFSHSFTLTFSYKLRAYDNVNPKSAMLDLMGNILNVTYNKGQFWGGQRKIIGPPQNLSSWNKANAIIDNAWDKLGGIFSNLNNLDDFSSILGAIGGAIGTLYKEAQKAIQSTVSTVTKDESGNTTSNGTKIVKNSLMLAIEYAKKVGVDSSFAKGMLKNALGRPAFYAMDSLLKGDNVGLWHLTIGNPKNPIAVMGNLILENSEIIHSGPLGIDDFPTELKVIVTLKHARSRDLTEIGRMYTNGLSALQYKNRYNPYEHFIYGGSNSSALNKYSEDNYIKPDEATSNNKEQQNESSKPYDQLLAEMSTKDYDYTAGRYNSSSFSFGNNAINNDTLNIVLTGESNPIAAAKKTDEVS